MPVMGPFHQQAYYTATLHVGTPPQVVSAVVDTHSHQVAFTCATCAGAACGQHTNPRFDPTLSITLTAPTCDRCPVCEAGQCAFRTTFPEGSVISGTLLEDVLWVGGNSSTDAAYGALHGTRYRFGCNTYETSTWWWRGLLTCTACVSRACACVAEFGLFPVAELMFSQRADGILGLSEEPNGLLTALIRSNRLDKAMFSLCLTLTDGLFILGGMETTMHQAPPVWTPLTSANGSDAYHVHLQEMTIGNSTFTLYVPCGALCARLSASECVSVCVSLGAGIETPSFKAAPAFLWSP